MFTIDGCCKDPGNGCFSHTPWTAEKVGVGYLVSLEGVFQCLCHMSLTHNTFEGIGPVFTCRYNVLSHRGRRVLKVGILRYPFRGKITKGYLGLSTVTLILKIEI